jgi:AcrR family transcriptional regulator
VVPKQKIDGMACAEADEQCRPLRADAVRNRARVLEAAEAVFAAQGISVPVDVIAEKAGVGVGTLYRHFPTKEKLFEAILIGRMVEVTANARSRLDSDDPGTAFFGFLEHVVRESALKRDLINALSGAEDDFEVAAADVKRDLEAVMAELLALAQRTGAVRKDVTPSVVMSLIGATCMAADTSHWSAPTEDLLAIVCDGLREHNRTM